MTPAQRISQRRLAERWGRGEISFAEYHDLMYQFYEA